MNAFSDTLTMLMGKFIAFDNFSREWFQWELVEHIMLNGQSRTFLFFILSDSRRAQPSHISIQPAIHLTIHCYALNTIDDIYFPTWPTALPSGWSNGKLCVHATTFITKLNFRKMKNDMVNRIKFLHDTYTRVVVTFVLEVFDIWKCENESSWFA